MNDLASGTSSWSTKLVHGGLRYLEYYEFRLVREALQEREVLWRIAPHIIRPLRFVLPHHRGLRPAWLLRLGLFLYDHIGGRRLLPGTRVLDLGRDAAGAPLNPDRFTTGFEYSDCAVDDARLVVLNARDAADRGAVIRTRHEAVAAERGREAWSLTVENRTTGARETVRAKAVVNAAGPWVQDVLARRLGSASKARVRLVQGSHIVVRRLFDHDRAYILQNTDGRIVFAIPYEGDFTLIGTTDRDYAGDPGAVVATDEEVDYLCRAVSQDLARPVGRADVVWRYSGVRPLYDDGASEAKAATRDYVFELDAPADGAPALSIFGGKITTYRRLAEAALGKLSPYLPQRDAALSGWTGREPLPGGDFPPLATTQLESDLQQRYPFLTTAHARRLARSYGTRAETWLGAARDLTDLGRDFGATLTEAELRHLVTQEWAVSADDVIWRRSKLGLRLDPAQVVAIDAWMATNMPA
ncbi:MAG: glycerol-3-phosphate dehydrogenase [Alphaproteobacteria bacterium]|nr:glycerol-3-phosphate dehydrogenase [Alphaproteobacteria bacterium]